jgi:hypothetical protein
MALTVEHLTPMIRLILRAPLTVQLFGMLSFVIRQTVWRHTFNG